jgi:hypothetical protein
LGNIKPKAPPELNPMSSNQLRLGHGMGVFDNEVSGRTVLTKPRSSTEFKLEFQLARKRCTPLIDGLNKYAEQLVNRPSLK